MAGVRADTRPLVSARLASADERMDEGSGDEVEERLHGHPTGAA
jgi:hypothetical protein